MISFQLPNAHSLAGLNVVDVPRLHTKSRVPGVDVARGANDAKRPRRVRIARHLLAHVIFARPAAPGLRPTQEYSLIAEEYCAANFFGARVEFRRVVARSFSRNE
jgi:hypothetical protein